MEIVVLIKSFIAGMTFMFGIASLVGLLKAQNAQDRIAFFVICIYFIGVIYVFIK